MAARLARRQQTMVIVPVARHRIVLNRVEHKLRKEGLLLPRPNFHPTANAQGVDVQYLQVGLVELCYISLNCELVEQEEYRQAMDVIYRLFKRDRIKTVTTMGRDSGEEAEHEP